MPKRRKKKSKFKRPRAGMKSIVKGRRVSPYSAPTYHKGYVYQQLKHTVLTISQMSEVDKRAVQATLKTIVTGPDAMTLPDGSNGWACQNLDLRGRAYLLSYKGIEVAVFYHRQLTELKLQPGDRFPEGVVTDPIEAWQRLDLLGLSAKKANIVLTTQHKRVEDENKLLTTRVETLQGLADALDKENRTLKEQRLNHLRANRPKRKKK
jgi:hypothetical protein